MDHDQNVVDARMAGEGGDGAGEHRRAADRPILLGAAGAGGRPGPSARRDDQSSHTHGDILMNKKKTNNIICLLQCGKTIIAPVENGQYPDPAQGKVMEFSCIKNMHKRVNPPTPTRRGYTA